MSNALVKGDYVLATKYRDGDPLDGYAVGFYNGSYDHFGSLRHLVVDGAGKQFRANGFRRAERISTELGAWIVKNRPTIEALTQIEPLNMWRYRRASARAELEAAADDPGVVVAKAALLRMGADYSLPGEEAAT